MAKVNKKTDKKTDKKAGSEKTSQIVILVIVLLLLVAVSVVTVLIATKKVDILASAAPPIKYVGEAERACGIRVKKDQGDMVSTMSVDDHSSFFDEASGEFKLFYELDVFNGSKQAGVKKFYVNCVVSSARGVIDRIEYLEEFEYKEKVIRREKGNAFGL